MRRQLPTAEWVELVGRQGAIGTEVTELRSTLFRPKAIRVCLPLEFGNYWHVSGSQGAQALAYFEAMQPD